MKRIILLCACSFLCIALVITVASISAMPSADRGEDLSHVHLPELPFKTDAFEPLISSRTFDIHYGKHHAGYVKKTKDLIAGSPYESMEIEDIIKGSARKADEKNIFNNSAQVWNHTFFWQSLSVGGGGAPEGVLKTMIDDSFGSYANFREVFIAVATSHFGSGWVWLVQDGSQLRIFSTSDAYNPIVDNLNPLIVLDVWEHAYYLDYQNRRHEFVELFVDKMIHWQFALDNLDD